MKFIYWAIGIRDKEPKNSINPNSMGTIPNDKFINFARTKEEIDEDKEPHSDIYHLKRMERLYGKSKKRKQQYESYYDYLNH